MIGAVSKSSQKRVVAFVDGQNLFHAVKKTFGYIYPNYDVKSLSEKVCSSQGWELKEVRFYTGIPDLQDNVRWHNFWTNKLRAMGRQGVKIFSRGLRYRNQVIRLPDGKEHTFLIGQEKGVDVRMALDIIRLGREDAYDIILIFSQDQDLSEVAHEVRQIAFEHNRWIKIASAFPASPTAKNRRGIDKTDWIRIDKATYDSCVDNKDYR